jgi:3-oxoacyl-[acyl-carrier-protein] synthase-3
MAMPLDELTTHLLGRVRLVQETLGLELSAPDAVDQRFADLLDSMGMVEFLMLLARDCAVTPGAVEECVGRRFSTVAELAGFMKAAGLLPKEDLPSAPARTTGPAAAPVEPACCLAAVAVRLPNTMQPAASLNAALGRPEGWLEGHAGIFERRVWGEQDALAAAVEAGHDCLAKAAVKAKEVGALLTTSEAPPLLAGLAAALHHRLGLRLDAVALEVGGACTGFLTALWLAQRLVPQVGHVLIVAVEAPSPYLRVEPGPAGEAAALFGDAAVAAVVTGHASGKDGVPVGDVVLGVDGSAGELIRVAQGPGGAIEVRLNGGPLAGRAVQAMAEAVRDQCHRYELTVSDLAAVVAHGGNGRLPAMLAHQLGLPPERIWSETYRTGNLGSASLPVAWTAQPYPATGPVAWVAVGAGLTWAAALSGAGIRHGQPHSAP